MIKHTPGPWLLSKRFGQAGAIVGGVMREYSNGSAQQQLFMVSVVDDANGGDEARTGNAMIATASLDLMYALMEFVDETASHTLTEAERLAKARAALRKAGHALVPAPHDQTGV